MGLLRSHFATLLLVAQILFASASAWAQTPPDSASLPVDSLRLIPCGRAVGLFYPDARVIVADTVAGWAKIFVEGWVPVEAALPYLNRPQLNTPLIPPNLSGISEESEVKKKDARQQCEALTTKGKRCSRKAEKNSKYCWQHQQR